MSLPRLVRAAAMAMALLCITPVVTLAQNPAAPVQALDDGLLTVMRQGKTVPFAERMQTLRPVVEQAFDLKQILQKSVGPRSATFSPTQQADLLDAFTDFTVANYVANFDNYSGEKFEILPDTRRAGPDLVVQSRIVPTTGEPTKLDYVIDGNRIVDILLDGSISRVAVQRSDFRSLIGTGDPSALITMLRNKSAGLATGDKG